MSDLWLTPEEVEELTAKKRWKAQCKALAAMGVQFEPNAVGRPLVARAKYAAGATSSRPRKKVEPNWSAIRGKAA